MSDEADLRPTAADLPRAAFGGALMGLANLVPGISGGTMLLAAGIYPRFVTSVAQLTALRLRPAPMITVGVVAGSALLTILLAAGTIGRLVVEQRWIMFSLFIGLTLGGVPLLARMMRGVTPAAGLGVITGILIMLGAVAAEHAGTGNIDDATGPSPIRLIIGGIAAGGAMILPGVSGSYLLILLGLYLPILEAVSSVRAALSDRDLSALIGAAAIIVPVGIGVVLSIAGISHLLRFLLRRFERVTLGVLLGLLLGAVVGLWPFRAPAQPEVGETVRGVPMMTAEQIEGVPMRHWRLERFSPSAGQAIGSILLVLTGFGLSAAVGRIGPARNT